MANSITITSVECDEKGPATPRYSFTSQFNRHSDEAVSPGVARIEAAAEHLTTANRACILFGVLLVAWAYGLDSTMRTSYQTLALNALDAQALLATVSVVRAVISSVTQVSILLLCLAVTWKDALWK